MERSKHKQAGLWDQLEDKDSLKVLLEWFWRLVLGAEYWVSGVFHIFGGSPSVTKVPKC